MEFDLGNALVRSWREGDEVSLARHANDRAVWINLRDRFPHPYTIDDGRDWLRFVGARTHEADFAIDVDGEAVGSVGLHFQDDVHRRSAEIGYWLGRAHWGRGIMTSAVRALTEYAFATFDLCRLYAEVFEWNPASTRVLEKAGYRREGRLRQSATKDGRTIDQFLYAITRESNGRVDLG